MFFQHPDTTTKGQHMTYRFDRRTVMGGVAALGASVAMPAIVRAQSKTLVAATFPGTWNEADRNVVSPAFKTATGAAVTQSIVLGTDQVARLTAAKGNKPPFDVAFFDTPQVLDAVRKD
jgi:putative spermidine/putrescine transport system substrate-binding protein